MIKQAKKIRLPADLYSRNTLFGLLTEHILATRTSEEHNRSLEILDVGGYQGKLSWFLPQHTKLTILDLKPAPEQANTNYVQGDAKTLPFPDGHFDLVISSDTLEHIDAADRAQVVAEMFRVSRRHVILAAPFDSIYNRKAEEFINTQFKQYTGHDHPFLIEHIQNGLPDADQIEHILTEKSRSMVKIGEGNIYNWYLQQLTTGAKLNQPIPARSLPQSEDSEGPEHFPTFNEFFNHHLASLGNFRAPTYRTVFFCDKLADLDRRQILNNVEEQNNFHTTTYFEAYKIAFDEIRNLLNLKDQELLKQMGISQKISEVEHHLEQEKHQSKAKENQIKILNSQIGEIQAVILERENELTETRKQIAALNDAIALQSKKMDLADHQIRTQDLLLTRLKHELENSQRDEQELTNLILLKEQSITEKSSEIQQKNQQIAGLQGSLAEYKRELETVLASRSWKLVRIYGRIKTALYLKPKQFLSVSWQVLTRLGLKEFLRRAKRKILKRLNKSASATAARNEVSDYQKFVEETILTSKDFKRIKEEIASFEYKPLISIIVPVYNVDEVWLRKAINSVLDQLYDKWELILADDASPNPRVREVLKEYAELDPRIHVNFRSQNGGIVKASQTALKMAKGAYVGLLDHDDEITKDALYEVVKALQTTRHDLIYSDEDKLEMDGTRSEPHFKPDFNLDLLFCNNYICHFSVFRRKILEEIGGFRDGTDGAQDYDLVLRFTEKKRSIHHIGKILYHWRKIPGSTAATINAKPYVFENAKKALRDTMKKRAIKGEVEDGIWKGSYRVKRAIEGQPMVSIVIPFRDKVEVLKVAIDSIFAKTTYDNYEIILVNNGSEMLETRLYLREVENCPRVRLLHYNAPFNFAAINNFAVEKAKGEYIIMLNNDTEVIAPDWIEAMLEHCQRSEVGCVGAKLLYPNTHIQHAGVIIGVGGAANHTFSRMTSDQNGYMGYINTTRDYSAVTAACMMVKKTVYEEMDGLDEENLAVSFNDVDFCLRLREKNYLVVYTPYALLYHHESYSRGYTVNFNEEYYLRRRHAGIFANGDPYYNRNLTKERLDFSLKVLDNVRDDV